ncbi:MAG: dihydrofolate reductase family protein [Rhizobiaceae bacterium]|nr:dihydrofolate reductase family protein [Rhizobiaceae bacterium]
MKPHVILHMGSSIDGRIVPRHWPEDMTAELSGLYERVHESLNGDAWIVGRVTMADFAEGDPNPAVADQVFPRTGWKAPGADTGPYAIAVDQGGKLHLNIGRINGDPIIMILVETVSDDHLAELRRDGISYIFAGRDDIDLPLAVERLGEEFGVKRLLLEGGGGINGAFLSAGLIDEISLLILPVADGGADMPTTFDRPVDAAVKLKLDTVERMTGDILHLRYSVF